MEFKKILPSPELQSSVRYYWVFEVKKNDAPFSQLLFPFGSFELIFNLMNPPLMKEHNDDPEFLLPDSIYPGQFTKPFVLKFTKNTQFIGISLQPWMGNLLFNIPAQEFTDKISHISNFDDKDQLREKLLESKNENELIQQLEIYLLRKIKRYKTDLVSSMIAKNLINNPSLHEFNNILSEIGISRRRVEQRFLETTGLPMGCFARKVRFQKAVKLLRIKCQSGLSQIGLEAGYYDQSHFIREFKMFSGLTPKEFAQHKSEMKSFVSELIG